MPTPIIPITCHYHLLFFSPAPEFYPTFWSFPWHVLNLLDISHPVSQILQTSLLFLQHPWLIFQNPFKKDVHVHKHTRKSLKFNYSI